MTWQGVCPPARPPAWLFYLPKSVYLDPSESVCRSRSPPCGTVLCAALAGPIKTTPLQLPAIVLPLPTYYCCSYDTVAMRCVAETPRTAYRVLP